MSEQNQNNDIDSMSDEEINHFLSTKIKRMRYNTKDDLLNNAKRFENNTLYFENELITSKSFSKDMRVSREFIASIDFFIDILNNKKKELKERIELSKKNRTQ